MKARKSFWWWRLASLVSLCFLALLYTLPTDSFYAVTIWPAFVWTSLAIALSLIGVRKHRSKFQIVVVFAWLLFWLVFGEEWRWIPRQLFLPAGGNRQIHIVSLNCAGGNPLAAAEALASKPDILLLQESPSKKEIEQQVGPSDYSILSGPDASIVSKGKLVPIELPRGTHSFVAAIVSLPDQAPIFVVSLRLQPPVFNLEYWSLDCWRSYAENRAHRRAELAEIAQWIKIRSGNRAMIVGGDFNTPPDRGTFAELSSISSPATSDSGYTAVNEFPMARIDQIWTRSLHSQGSYALRTQNSDHRMVRLWLSY